MQNHSKILLAVDGSDASLNAVRHIGQVFSKQRQIVMFHVLSDVPEAFKDLKAERSINAEEFPLETWQARQRTIITDFMEKARAALIESGFEPKAVEVRVQELKSGIARDIHNESLRGYAALVVGRTGVSKIDDIMMGSVASKLVEVSGHLPIIVVGAHSDSKKILVALDGSTGSMQAVQFVSAAINPDACELMLCHVVRLLDTQKSGTRELFALKHEKDWIASNQRQMVPTFIEAKKQLMHAGVSAEKLISEILTYEKSRAAAIVKAATDGGYDTIAMGRRGLTSVEEFKLGRVCRKILHFAFRPALWIAS
jgi:nucleotide-binding universal stress UspA family protein